MLPFEFPVAENDIRIRRIRSPRYVDYEAGNAILNRLAWLYNHPKAVRPPCSLIYGDTNNGKTALAYKFVRDFSPREDSPEYGKRPVVYVHAPPFADLNGFYDAILRSVKAPYRSTARPQAKWDQLLQLLGAVGTRVLILDEVNNLLIGKVDQRSMVLNSLKSLSNELKIPVVAMGTQDAVRVFQTDQQLGNRFEPIGIPRWALSKDYAVFIARYVQRLELKQESNFRSKELVGRIHSMSEGLTGETCKLLALAAEMAVHTEREIIDLGTLDQVPWVMPSERRRMAR
ncbi:AAA family ATPase [Azospirillum sp. TSA2s]|uniref:TniB family NTP-binding protein n=1 Tax=Azospirillum sp. TSA2s TaxID=709810 RepID=UPI0010AAFDA6|nr:TniB family NTP-binding protein [Azospirillum sp. TSA2s]QCG98711.1 AAA family ATPase [Azospirillum sp. TSA2s]